MADDNSVPEIFADSVLTVTLANGVFRLVLAQQDENNRARTVGRLLVPANQMPAMLRGVAKAMSTLAAKGRQEAPRAGETTGTDAATSPLVGSEAGKPTGGTRSKRRK